VTNLRTARTVGYALCALCALATPAWGTLAPAARQVEDEAGRVDEIRTVVRRACDGAQFSGAVLIARHGEVLFEDACGEASKRFGVPNNLDTRFNLGSMNKMFTSVSIAQLVEKGLVSWNDPISEYVDESWLPRSITEQVTVHHLLSHTSGLGSYFNQDFMNGSRAGFRELDDYKPLVRSETLAFEPGEGWQYSNTGMFLLGVVIREASGQDYFDYIRENIYAPAGMTRSDSYDMDEPIDNLAIGYDPAPGTETGWQNNIFKHVIRGGPAGGGFSTVHDLHRFAQALLSERLVSESTKQVLWTDYADRDYGYGFRVRDTPNGEVVGHSGGFPGINSFLGVYLDTGIIVAVMSNYGNGVSTVLPEISQAIER